MRARRPLAPRRRGVRVLSAASRIDILPARLAEPPWPAGSIHDPLRPAA
ncbi:hypothetical protein [Methylobacterium nigriterrae]